MRGARVKNHDVRLAEIAGALAEGWDRLDLCRDIAQAKSFVVREIKPFSLDNRSSD